MIVILSLSIAVPIWAYNGGRINVDMYQPVQNELLISCSTPVVTDRLKGRINYTSTSVSRLFLTVGAPALTDNNNVTLYNWVLANRFYAQEFNTPGDFDIDLTSFSLTDGNFNIWLSDGLRIISQYSFVLASKTPYLKEVDLSGLNWVIRGVQTSTPVSSFASLSISAADSTFSFLADYKPKSDSKLLVYFDSIYFANVSKYSPVFLRRTSGPSAYDLYFYNVTTFNSANRGYYALYTPSQVSNFSFSAIVKATAAGGNFCVSGLKIYELQTEDQHEVGNMVDALDDPSFGDTTSSGGALNDATNDSNNIINDGGNKSDSLVDSSISGADTSDFDSRLNNLDLKAGLSFWRSFFDFFYGSLDFYKVLVGLCISLGTFALVLGISGRVKKYLKKGDDE